MISVKRSPRFNSRVAPFLALGVLGLIVALPAWAGDSCLEGNGVAATVTRQSAPFTALVVNGAFNVQVLCGRPMAVSLSGDSNILPQVLTTVNNGTMEISANRSICSTIPVTIAIAMPTLKSLVVDGAGDTVVGKIDADSFVATIEGAVSVRLQGRSKKLILEAGGSSTVQAGELQASEVTAKTGGSASAVVYATKSLTAECREASDLKYAGSPKSTNLRTFDVCDLDSL